MSLSSRALGRGCCGPSRRSSGPRPGDRSRSRPPRHPALTAQRARRCRSRPGPAPPPWEATSLAMEAALKSWVFPSPVVTPVLSSSNTDAHWAPFSLQTLNSHFGGSNNHIKRLHLVSVHIGASTIAECLCTCQLRSSRGIDTGPFIYN
jgi:hypothetical protein